MLGEGTAAERRGPGSRTRTSTLRQEQNRCRPRNAPRQASPRAPASRVCPVRHHLRFGSKPAGSPSRAEFGSQLPSTPHAPRSAEVPGSDQQGESSSPLPPLLGGGAHLCPGAGPVRGRGRWAAGGGAGRGGAPGEPPHGQSEGWRLQARSRRGQEPGAGAGGRGAALSGREGGRAGGAGSWGPPGRAAPAAPAPGQAAAEALPAAAAACRGVRGALDALSGTGGVCPGRREPPEPQ